LILTSRLLSPRDEAGLHAIDRAGIPVPTLMIPVLAASSNSQQERGGGLLKRLPWGRSGSGPSPADNDGCDPEVFASQIAEYLVSVQEEREKSRVHEVHKVQGVHAVPVVHAVPEVQAAPEVHAIPEVPEFVASHEVLEEHASAFAAPQDAYVDPGTRVDTVIMASPEAFDPPEAAAEPAFLAETAFVAAPPATVEPEVIVELDVIAEAASEPEFIAEAASAPESVAEPVVADVELLTDMVARAELIAAPSEPASEGPDWEDIVLEEFDDAAIELSGEAIDLRAFVEELEASSGEASAPLRIVPPRVKAPEHAAAKPVFDEPVFAAQPPPVRVVPAVPRFAVANALPTRVAWPTLQGISAEEAPVATMTEIVADFAAALTAAEDEPDSPCPDDADSDLWMPLSAAAALAWPRLDSSCSTSSRRAQDEWGFFDPEQCGFSALVAKLDQMGR
jgi:hypothetical protein